MRFAKSFQLALNILVHAKLRSWLTILGIVIGVAAIVSIVSIGQGAQANVQASLGGLGADQITVSPGFSRAEGGFRGGGGGLGGGSSLSTKKNLTDKDVAVLKTIDGVTFVNPQITGRADLTYLSETASMSVRGVDPFAWRNIVTSELDSGRYLQQGDTGTVVIGSRIATGLFKQPLGVNRDVTIGGKSFKIVGILKAADTFGGDDNTVVMSLDDAVDIIANKQKNNFDSIVVRAASADSVSSVSASIDARLLVLRHETNRTRDFSVSSQQATQARIASVTQTLTIFLGAIAAVSLLVGAVGIANTMFTSVLEKTKEIGIMKAIGAKNSDIMRIFLLNAALVGFVGGLLGIGFGALISTFLPSVLSNLGGAGRQLSHTALSWGLLLSALGISVAIGVIAGAIPAYRASRLKPVDALRYE
jgi:putative ABC transport system permease protein